MFPVQGAFSSARLHPTSLHKTSCVCVTSSPVCRAAAAGHGVRTASYIILQIPIPAVLFFCSAQSHGKRTRAVDIQSPNQCVDVGGCTCHDVCPASESKMQGEGGLVLQGRSFAKWRCIVIRLPHAAVEERRIRSQTAHAQISHLI